MPQQNFEQNKRFLRALPAGRISHFTSRIYPSLAGGERLGTRLGKIMIMHAVILPFAFAEQAKLCISYNLIGSSYLVTYGIVGGPRWGLLLGVMAHIFFTARIFTVNCYI